jgi:hypothetical protein
MMEMLEMELQGCLEEALSGLSELGIVVAMIARGREGYVKQLMSMMVCCSKDKPGHDQWQKNRTKDDVQSSWLSLR